MSETNSTPSANCIKHYLADLVKVINSRRPTTHKPAASTPKPTRVHKAALKATTPTPKVAPAPFPLAAMLAFDKAMLSLKPTDPEYVLAKFAELNGTDSDASFFSSITSPSSLGTDDEQSEYPSSL